jgi:hypothetical protein
MRLSLPQGTAFSECKLTQGTSYDSKRDVDGIKFNSRRDCKCKPKYVSTPTSEHNCNVPDMAFFKNTYRVDGDERPFNIL